MQVEDWTELASLRALVDRARSNLRGGDLADLVMNDPGAAGYVSAYERVLAGGVPALFEDYEASSLLRSFDITENLLLSHHDAGKSSTHRWFSILTASIELVAWDGFGGLRAMTPSVSLCHLVTDSHALRAVGDSQAPLDLLSGLAREIRRTSPNRHHQQLTLLVELLVGPSEDQVNSLCRQLVEDHDEFQSWGDDEGNENPWFLARPELMWGTLSDRREVRAWLALVEAHFPETTELAHQTRQRLVDEGRAYRPTKRSKR